MQFVKLALSILQPARLLIVSFACTLLFFTSIVPALAITSYQSEPTEGTTQLLETQRLTDKAAQSPPAQLKEVQEKSNKGLNEVQGDADIDKMKNPQNSQSATSVEDEVSNFLKKVTGNK